VVVTVRQEGGTAATCSGGPAAICPAAQAVKALSHTSSSAVAVAAGLDQAAMAIRDEWRSGQERNGLCVEELVVATR